MAVAELQRRVRLRFNIPLYPTEKLWTASIDSVGWEYCPAHRDPQGSKCLILYTTAIRPAAKLIAYLKEPLRLERILPSGSTNPTLDKAVIYTMACGGPYFSTQRIYTIATEKGTLVSKSLDMGSCGSWNKIEFPDQPLDLSGMNVLNASIKANLVTVPPLRAEFHFMGMELVVSAEVREDVVEKATVRVCVKDAKTDRAIPLASVELWSDGLVKSGRTGLSGCTTLSDVPTTRTGTRYKLVASAPGYAGTSQPVTVVPGFNDFEVKLERSVPGWVKWGVIGAGAIVIGGTVMAYARRGAGGERAEA
jgi:hypothetical protein